MCNVTIPENTVASPVSTTQIDEKVLNQLYQDNLELYDGVDAGGDVPLGLGTSNSRTSPNIQYITPGEPPEGGGFIELNTTLDTALENGDSWQEYGTSPPNPYIGNCYEICGISRNTADGGKSGVPWCAAFVSFMLYQSGIESLKTLSSQAYLRYGTEIEWTDWSKVRINDIVVLTNRAKPSNGHVGFFRGYNSKKDQIILLGGNQSNKVKLSVYPVNNPSKKLYVRSVKRNWSVPEKYDSPLYVDATGKPEGYALTR